MLHHILNKLRRITWRLPVSCMILSVAVISTTAVAQNVPAALESITGDIITAGSTPYAYTDNFLLPKRTYFYKI